MAHVDMDRVLASINAHRAHHQAPPLAAHEGARQNAQAWANRGVFEHSPDSGYGENLAMVYKPGATEACLEAVKLWQDESAIYNYNKPGFSMETGHFTQQCWVSTRGVGFGVAKVRGGQWNGAWLVVAQYDPPGNCCGQFRVNVKPPAQRGQAPAAAAQHGQLYQPDPDRCDVLIGQHLRSETNAQIHSMNGRYKLVQQSDSHLVLYDGQKPIWSNNMWNRGVERTVMQHDGNLVSYTHAGKAVWSSGTHGYPGAHLIVQDDGNCVIYHGTKPIWHTNTWRG